MARIARWTSSISGVVGVSPVLSGQVTEDEIKRCEQDPTSRLVMLALNVRHDDKKGRSGREKRYTPLARRHDRPNAIAWFLKFCPALPDADIIRIVRTTKKTIQSIRGRTHLDMADIKPEHPVGLGFCTQEELDALLQKVKG